MIRKLSLIIITFNLIACSSAPFIPPSIENQRAFDLSGTQIIDILGKSLPKFLESTSSKTPTIDKKGMGLTITNYKPNDSSFTECTIANNGGWANIWNGLDHGVISIILTPIGSNTTYVEVKSSFHENYSVQVPGNVTGYVGGYAVRDIDYIDKGSHCYSTGLIERSIFDLIQAKAVSATAETAPIISSKNEADKLKNSTLEGQKTITLPDGTKYIGELKNGIPEGQGTMTLPDNTKFVGEFKNGNPEGQGAMTLPDRTKFVGEFKNGKPEKQATMTLPDGTKYMGEFKNGIPEGHGTYILPNGIQKKVTFKNGALAQ